MKPTYAENIIVAIKNNNCIKWYILEKDYCFLDYVKLEEAYRAKGYKIVIDEAPRYGIKIINRLTKEEFLNNIEKNEVSSMMLNEMLMNEKNYNEKLAYNPSILIDFDDETFMSHYSEPESFEEFVPDGWKGIYQNFEDIVPQGMRYWVGENGKSLIGE